MLICVRLKGERRALWDGNISGRLLARATAKGYEQGAHREINSVREVAKYVEQHLKIEVGLLAGINSKYRLNLLKSSFANMNRYMEAIGKQ